MTLAKKVWCPDDEIEPQGLSHLTSAPANWFREEPALAAELYGLERGTNNSHSRSSGIRHEYRVYVLDEANVRHTFLVEVTRSLQAHVRSST